MRKLKERFHRKHGIVSTKKHRAAIREFGVTPYHRMSYNLLGTGELSIDFKD